MKVKCSYVELYGGRSFDLLNDKQICHVREDQNGRVRMKEALPLIPSPSPSSL